MTQPTPAVIVLCGGQSRRFGTDKGLAVWRGKTLIDHVLDRLPPHHRPTVLVMRQEQQTLYGEREQVTVISDHQAHAGPLRGVIRGLEHLAGTASWAWVVACDQPLVCPALLTALVDKITIPAQAIIPEWESRLQPLTGLYPVAAASALRQQHEAGENSLLGALATIPHTVIPATECRASDPLGLGFRNINRGSDLAELERHYAPVLEEPHREL